MTAIYPTQERWAKLSSVIRDGLGVSWASCREQVARQDAALSGVVAPVLEGERWFFRRRDLPHDNTPRYNDTVIVLLRLPRPSADPKTALAPLRAALTSSGHVVVAIEEWDANPGHGDAYDHDAAVNAEWRDFRCAAAEKYLKCCRASDARRVAGHGLARRPPWGKRLVHWLCWISGDSDKAARLAEFGI
jgi:hypothetical protein